MGRNFWENGYVHWGMNIDGSHGFQHSYFPSVFCPSVYIRIHLLDLSHFLWYCLKLLIGILVLKISCFGVIFVFVFICFFEGGYKLDAIIWMKWDEIFLIFTILFGIVLIGASVSKIICFGVHFFFRQKWFHLPLFVWLWPKNFLTFGCTEYSNDMIWKRYLSLYFL